MHVAIVAKDGGVKSVREKPSQSPCTQAADSHDLRSRRDAGSDRATGSARGQLRTTPCGLQEEVACARYNELHRCPPSTTSVVPVT
jgi:hypothetical protein